MNLTYALLGLVAFLVLALIHFAIRIFGVLTREIAKANKRFDDILDRNMADNLSDYSENQWRKTLLESDKEQQPARIAPKEESSKSHSGEMFD